MYSRIDLHSTGEPVVLCTSGSGEVRLCPDCGDMELSFGNLILALTPDDADRLARQVTELQDPDALDSETVIQLSENGIGARFSQAELQELLALLEGAGSLRTHSLMESICAPRNAHIPIVH